MNGKDAQTEADSRPRHRNREDGQMQQVACNHHCGSGQRGNCV
jgi:hypothetical protein